MNVFYLLVLLLCCSCQNRTDCANWNERRDAGDNRQQDMRIRDTDCGCRNGDRVQYGCSCENAGPMSEQQDCNCRQQMSRQGGMQRYDRELKESAAFDSVPGMEKPDGHPYPVYRETDEVR